MWLLKILCHSWKILYLYTRTVTLKFLASIWWMFFFFPFPSLFVRALNCSLWKEVSCLELCVSGSLLGMCVAGTVLVKTYQCHLHWLASHLHKIHEDCNVSCLGDGSLIFLLAFLVCTSWQYYVTDKKPKNFPPRKPMKLLIDAS